MRKITRQQLRDVHANYADTPRTADLHVQTVRMILKWAEQELEWISNNPGTGIDLFGAQKEFKPSPVAAQKAYRNACTTLGNEAALTFFLLGTGTGQRAGDY